MIDLKNLNSPKFVAKQVYGYVILASLAVGVAMAGVFIIYMEQRKYAEERNQGRIIIGICISSAGSLIMLLTILYLLTHS